jgi:spore coat protein JB
MQDSADPAYESSEALSRGTLFPGLDLPFMNVVNPDLPATPMTEMMAIDFVADELSLYLDTHKEDTEAFEVYQSVLALSHEAHKHYAADCGPLTKSDMLGMKKYDWLNDPWPWEKRTEKEA